ncbi:MAG: ATP synthase subunit I [Deltaproteobacteria bacterium]|jgi:hypothetical protein|nr:ATP synthase subunit I [Deltaproteobacteria bacterium]
MSKAIVVGRPADSFSDVVEASRLVRLCARVLTILLALGFTAFRGLFWGWGVLMAGLALEINLDCFLTFAKNSRPGPLHASLKFTLLWYYLIFILTMVYCFVVIRFKLGHPLAFLAGLGLFVPSVLTGLLRYYQATVKKSQSDLSSQKDSNYQASSSSEDSSKQSSPPPED